MKKLTLGKKTLLSINGQIVTILESIHGGRVKLNKIKPQRTDIGNFVRAYFNTLNEPDIPKISVFAMQRVNDCCDIWLESPANTFHTSSNHSA